MEVKPYQGTLHGGPPQPAVPEPSQFRSKLVGCLLMIGIVGVVIVLLLPAQRRAGPAARRMQCANNLKQIGLALHLYADEYGAFPPAYTVDAEGKPLHSWRTLILPFMEQEPVYKLIDLSKPWDDPANKRAFELGLPYNACPSIDLPATHTTYLAVAVPGACFKQTESRKLSEITDGQASTLMVIEVDVTQAVHWMVPTDSINFDLLKSKSGAKLPHPHGYQAVFVDGSVHFLSADIQPETLKALITIDAKDVVGEY